ncbi:unnamed protein product, partial [Leptidea sinapis]
PTSIIKWCVPYLSRVLQFTSDAYFEVDKLESEHKIDGSVLVVIYTENCEDFIQLNHKFSENHKYLIITQEPKNKCGEVSKNTSIAFIMRDITCVTKVNNGSSYIIKTATVEIEDKTCNIVDQPIFKEINSCYSGFLKINQSVFPKKNLRNFRKCNFNVGMGTLSPYATMEKKHLFYNLASINLSNISGSDVDLIKIIADHFNSTLKVYYIMKDEENRFAHNEFIKFLLNGSLDVCAGGLYRIYGDVVHYSGVYTRQAVVWAYGVERDTRSWQSFVHKIKDALGINLPCVYFELAKYLNGRRVILENGMVRIHNVNQESRYSTENQFDKRVVALERGKRANVVYANVLEPKYYTGKYTLKFEDEFENYERISRALFGNCSIGQLNHSEHGRTELNLVADAFCKDK